MSDERRKEVQAAPPMTSPLALRQAIASAEGFGLGDVRRICSLLVERPPTPEECEAVSRAEVAPAWFDGTAPGARGRPFRLWTQQVHALLQYDLVGGGHFPIPVSGGKETIQWLVLKHAHAPRPAGQGIRRSLLVVPSDVYGKLVEIDRPLVRSRFGVDVPVHFLGRLPPARRMELCRSGLAGVYATTYSLIQQSKTGAAELDAIAPQLVVANECHCLANARRNPAVRKRLFSTIAKFQAGAVWLSGTMDKRSFLDAAPLMARALRERAPVPLDPTTAERWAAVIDSGAARVPNDLLEALEPLRQWALEKVREGVVDPADVGGPLTPDPAGLRRAWRVRRNTAPGVVATAESALGTELKIKNRPAYEQAGVTDRAGWEALVDRVEARLEETLPRPLSEDFCPSEAFSTLPPIEQAVSLMWALQSRSRTPSGDEVEWAFHLWEHLFEISSAGFYNELTWPEVPDLARERGIPEKAAEELIARAREHRLARRRYSSRVRSFLLGGHVEGIDSPLLCWNACERHDRRVPDEMYRAWLGVRAAEFEGMPSRVSNVRRVCDWKVRAAVEWARKVEAEYGPDVGGLVWAWNEEALAWLYEVFSAEFGLDRVAWCPSGQAGSRRIQDPSCSRKWAIAAIGGHCKGKDLFHFQHQVFVQWPQDVTTVQQALGRTHREGQQADELIVRTLLTSDWDHESFSATLHGAMWVSQSSEKQKIILAGFDPLPRIYPAKFLEERGFKVDALDQEDALRLVLGGVS